jgi:hypothetical protein
VRTRVGNYGKFSKSLKSLYHDAQSRNENPSTALSTLKHWMGTGSVWETSVAEKNLITGSVCATHTYPSVGPPRGPNVSSENPGA